MAPALTVPKCAYRKSDVASPMPVEATLAIQNQAVICGTLVTARRAGLASLLWTPPVAMAVRMPQPPPCGEFGGPATRYWWTECSVRAAS